MEALLDKVETELNLLVENISRYNPIETQARKFVELDEEVVEALAAMKQHYAACKRLEELRFEISERDRQIDSVLVALSNWSKELSADNAEDENFTGIDVDTLLNYATKITKFTHKQPGSEHVLSWPSEDQIRKGMLATLAVQNGTQLAEPSAVEQAQQHQSQEDDKRAAENEHDPEKRSAGAGAPRKPVKLNLDLDSDED